CTIDNASANTRAKWPISTFICGFPIQSLAFPNALFFQAASKVFWNVIFIVLSEDIIRPKNPVGAKPTFSHYALPFTEEIRRNTFKGHFNGLNRVGYCELKNAALAGDGPFFNKAAQAKACAGS